MRSNGEHIQGREASKGDEVNVLIEQAVIVSVLALPAHLFAGLIIKAHRRYAVAAGIGMIGGVWTVVTLYWFATTL